MKDSTISNEAREAAEHIVHLAALLHVNDILPDIQRAIDTATATDKATIATLNAQFQMRESVWQPIATAPKNGTVILGKLPYSDVPQSIVFRDGTWCVQWDNYRLSKFDQPTHWLSISSL